MNELHFMNTKHKKTFNQKLNYLRLSAASTSYFWKALAGTFLIAIYP